MNFGYWVTSISNTGLLSSSMSAIRSTGTWVSALEFLPFFPFSRRCNDRLNKYDSDQVSKSGPHRKVPTNVQVKFEYEQDRGAIWIWVICPWISSIGANRWQMRLENRNSNINMPPTTVSNFGNGKYVILLTGQVSPWYDLRSLNRNLALSALEFLKFSPFSRFCNDNLN